MLRFGSATIRWIVFTKINKMGSKIGFEMSLIIVEAIRGRCASFIFLVATVSEIFGGQTTPSILVVGHYGWRNEKTHALPHSCVVSSPDVRHGTAGSNHERPAVCHTCVSCHFGWETLALNDNTSQDEESGKQTKTTPTQTRIVIWTKRCTCLLELMQNTFRYNFLKAYGVERDYIAYHLVNK